MGNMKPSTPGYQEKWNEKRAKQIEEAKEDPRYNVITGLAWGASSLVSSSRIGHSGNFEEFMLFLTGQATPFDVLVSPDPSGAREAIIREFFRRDINVPVAFPYRTLNVLKLFGGEKSVIFQSCVNPSEVLVRLDEILERLGPRVYGLAE